MRSLFVVFSVLVLGAFGFNATRHDNVVMYWGQDTRGAMHPNELDNYQKPLSYYCRDNSTDVIPIAFLNKFFSTGGLPEINLGNTCNKMGNGMFPGTSLLKCKRLTSEIKACQARGKLITLSLGGAAANVTFSGDKQAKDFAETVWDLFLGGASKTRPFGDAVLDGINLDIESGTTTGYAAFVNRIRFLAKGARKKYHITASPQCAYPDATLGAALNATSLDAVYVQFYNNPCGLQNYNGTSEWNFGLWDFWARNVSSNKNVKVYIGAPGADGGNVTGYVPVFTLSSIAVTMRQNYPSFGGVMLWDASQAYANGRYDMGIKKALQAAGGVGFKYPACSAHAYVHGQAYIGRQQVSYDGYIWQAKWWTNTVPNHDPLGEWMEVSACKGLQSTSDIPAMPGIPTGSLGNGAKGVYGRAYFWNMESRLRAFLFLFLLSYLHR